MLTSMLTVLPPYSSEKILCTAGLPHFRFHGLRHTAATLVLEVGIHPKVVAERLGHASTRMTLDRYSTLPRHAARCSRAV